MRATSVTPDRWDTSKFSARLSSTNPGWGASTHTDKRHQRQKTAPGQKRAERHRIQPQCMQGVSERHGVSGRTGTTPEGRPRLKIQPVLHPHVCHILHQANDVVQAAGDIHRVVALRATCARAHTHTLIFHPPVGFPLQKS